MEEYILLMAMSFCMSFAFLQIFISFKKYINSRKTVIIDVDTLVNTEPVINKAKLWISNCYDMHSAEAQQNFDLAYEKFLNKAEYIEDGIIRALKLKDMGFNLVFVYARPEHYKSDVYTFLSKWGLTGRLYMVAATKKHLYNCIHYKEDYIKGLISEVKHDYKKIHGVITDVDIV